MDESIVVSLLEYTSQFLDMGDILTISSNKIYDLHSFKITDFEAPIEEEDSTYERSTPLTTPHVKADIPRGSKRLMKVFIRLNMYMSKKDNPIFNDCQTLHQASSTHINWQSITLSLQYLNRLKLHHQIKHLIFILTIIITSTPIKI